MNWKIALILFLVVLVAIFILQNHEITKVKFLLWTLEASRAAVLFLTLLIGIIIGGVVSFVVRSEKMKTVE
jgi:uncharacterized integral membrane protein